MTDYEYTEYWRKRMLKVSGECLEMVQKAKTKYQMANNELKEQLKDIDNELLIRQAQNIVEGRDVR